MLAITFTRKAAAEMRSRILLTLQRAAQFGQADISARPVHEQQSLQLARAVLDTSSALGWNILEHPARLQVRTLDSFCESVAQRAPFKGLLGGVAQVTEDAQPLYELAAQRVIDQLADSGTRGDAVASLLVYLDNDVRGARDLLAAMLAQRDQWLHFLGRSDAFDESQQQSLRSKLEAALALSVEEELALIRARLQIALNSAQAAELFALMRYSADQLANGLTHSALVIESIAASAEVVSIASQNSNDRSLPPASAGSLPAWRAICEFLLTGDRGKPALRKTVNMTQRFPIRHA